MSKLLVKPEGTHGRITHITPESAGWDFVGFDMHRLQAGETVSDNTGDREVCLVYVTGKGTARAGDEDFGSLGKRMSPFEGCTGSYLRSSPHRLDGDGGNRNGTGGLLGAGFRGVAATTADPV